MEVFMNWRFNYMGLLSLLSLIGLLSLLRADSGNAAVFFVFLTYIGYFFITPDELFRQRVHQVSTFTLTLVLFSMVGFFVAYHLTANPDHFMNGFWVTFTLMIVTFPVTFTIFEIKDASHPK